MITPLLIASTHIDDKHVSLNIILIDQHVKWPTRHSVEDIKVIIKTATNFFLT